MSFTKVYRFQNLPGYESVISKGNSEMTYMGFGRILLEAGQTLEYTVTGEEQAVVLQQGDFRVWVEYDGQMVINGREGTRGNVYDDMPTALYLPPRAKVKLTSKNGMEARVYTAYCDEGNAPYFCPPEEIEEGEPGEYIYKRKYRFIFGQPGKHNDHITKLLIVGETVSVPGGWIGFPAHRHDYERPGKEVVLDEIFSFQMTSEGTGKGGVLQHGYDLTDDNQKLWDEVNVIEENNTAVALPVGYHTTVALPGTVAYLLWGLAGDTKKYKVQFDERYSWLEGCLYSTIQIATWKSVGVDPVSVDWNELFVSLQQKLIDGEEGAIANYKDYSFYEVAKYFTYTDHVMGTDMIICTESWLNSLDEADRTLVEEACKAAYEYHRDHYISEDEVLLEQLVKENGVEVIELDPAVKAELAEKMSAASAAEIVKVTGQELEDQFLKLVDAAR